MKFKLMAAILGFAVAAVFSTAIDCGCRMAHASVTKQAQSPAAHCGGDLAHTPQKQDSDQCCVGCVLENPAVESATILLSTPNSSIFYLKDFFSDKASFNARTIPYAYKFSFNIGNDSRGVPGLSAAHPFYIAYGSLLV